MSERTTAASRGAAETATPRTTTAVQWWLGLSLAVYFVQLTVLKASDIQSALGVDAQAVSRHWWSALTYPFAHGGFWTLALNLYALWMFGPRVEATWGTRSFVRYLVICAVGGWMAHLLLVPPPALLIGAAAPVLGVLLAYATLWPNEPVLVFGAWPMSTRWFLLVVAGAVLASTASLDEGGVSSLAHVGGLLAGWLYLRAIASVDLDRFRQGVSPVPELPEDELPRAIPKTAPRHRTPSIDEVVAQANAPVAPVAPKPRPRRAVPRSAGTTGPASGDGPTLDSILDKISASGLESLSPDERRILDAASRRLRES